jgi:hypothetical protein
VGGIGHELEVLLSLDGFEFQTGAAAAPAARSWQRARFISRSISSGANSGSHLMGRFRQLIH